MASGRSDQAAPQGCGQRRSTGGEQVHGLVHVTEHDRYADAEPDGPPGIGTAIVQVRQDKQGLPSRGKLAPAAADAAAMGTQQDRQVRQVRGTT